MKKTIKKTLTLPSLVKTQTFAPPSVSPPFLNPPSPSVPHSSLSYVSSSQQLFLILFHTIIFGLSLGFVLIFLFPFILVWDFVFDSLAI